MKKLLIFCAFCCTSLMMSAQTNSWAQKFVNNITEDIDIPAEQIVIPATDISSEPQWCNRWNVLSHGWDIEGGDGIYNGYTITYQLEEDTLINDLTYQKLAGYFSLTPSNKKYIAALRFAEDKKVFVHYDRTEYLLYDFGAQVGDTLTIFGGISHYTDAKTLTHIVTEIDTLKDGQLKIQLVVKLQQNGYEKSSSITWIEGIGSINGIIGNNATLRVGSGVHVLLCAYHNDDCIYTTEDSFYIPYGCVYNDPIFTATEEVKSTNQSVQKIIYNGQLLILRDGKTYNIMGMEAK